MGLSLRKANICGRKICPQNDLLFERNGLGTWYTCLIMCTFTFTFCCIPYTSSVHKMTTNVTCSFSCFSHLLKALGGVGMTGRRGYYHGHSNILLCSFDTVLPTIGHFLFFHSPTLAIQFYYPNWDGEGLVSSHGCGN